MSKVSDVLRVTKIYKTYKPWGTDDDGNELPFPNTDLSPTLQRTIKLALDSGELDEVEREELERLIGRAARPDGE